MKLKNRARNYKPEALEQQISVLMHLAQHICEHLRLPFALVPPALRPT